MNVTEYLPRDLFKGKPAFVTGGGSGINLGVAKTFAALGADVAICGRKAERLEAAAAELRAYGGRVSTSVADVRDLDALRAAFAKSSAELGPAYTVVCGAAGNFVARAESLSSNGFRAVVDIDLIGSFHASLAAFEQLRATRGNLIFISAGQASRPYAFQAHVGAAKAGVESLMRNLALEWGRYGIRSNAIVPGPIEDTEGMRRLGGAAGGDEQWSRNVPLGRFGRADEIGAMAAILASPLSAYVTGTVVDVDGGSGLGGSAGFNAAVARTLAESAAKGDA